MTTRTYPKRCGKCGQKVMQLATLPYATTIDHDGRAYRVQMPGLTVPQCANCQAISIDDEADRQISAAFRREARLLAPDEIRQGREKLGLTHVGRPGHRFSNARWTDSSGSVSPAPRRWNCYRAIPSRAPGVRRIPNRVTRSRPKRRNRTGSISCRTSWLPRSAPPPRVVGGAPPQES
jgi:hypothetical protein